MKRGTALQTLSQDHHQALVVAQKLRRATVDTAPAARRAFLSFWQTDGQKHFRVEEEVLLPAFARHADAGARDAVIRVLAEHVDLRRRAGDMEAQPTPPLHQLRQLGETLHDHVRHEERALFPLVEQALPEPELEALATALAAA
ncbi:MAG: hemerythrin domain-containing protein [Actinomycetota bacterium]|nr:hemerythrin domain-containing protein [Actinomycetota bacterium]